jgi:hypothetical protein
MSQLPVLNLKMVTVILLKTPFSAIGRCSPVPICHWIQAAFNIIFRDHKRLSKCIYRVKSAAVRSLKRVSKRIFGIK